MYANELGDKEMNSFEVNKWFGGLVLALLVAWLSGFVAEKVLSPEVLHEAAYKIDLGVATANAAEAAPAAEELPPVGPLLASADPAKGEQLVKACAACHSFDKGGANKVGPALWDIVNSNRARLGEGFAYSAAMKGAGGTWTYDNLNTFLAKPRQAVPGTKMAFAGMAKPEDRAAVIAYLRTLSDSPAPLP